MHDLDGENYRAPQRLRQPTQWAHDLNDPQGRTYDVIGRREAGPAAPANAGLPDRTASDIKEVTRLLADWHDDELRMVPVVPTGTTLEYGATYMDLNDPERREIVAGGHLVAGPDDVFIPKRMTPYHLWNRLRGPT